MEIVKIDGKTYIAGLEWYLFDNKEDATAKQKELGNANIIKLSNNRYLVYKEPNEKGYILASGFLHLAPGHYYYMILDDGRKWILLQGNDGSILYDDVVKDFTDAEEKHYELFSSFLDNSGKMQREEIFISDGKKFRKAGKKTIKLTDSEMSIKTYITAGISIAIILGGLYMIYDMFMKPKKPAVMVRPQITMAQTQTKPQPPPVITLGKLDIKKCFSKYYHTGSCKMTVQDMRVVDPKTKCKDVINKIRKLIDDYSFFYPNSTSLKWGVSQNTGKFYLYSFSMVGPFLLESIKFLQNVYFENGTMSMSMKGDDILDYSITISGVFACKKE
ncbi:MAG: hypothetical protein QXE51_05780 [Nitrososphaeria archaeon]